MKSLSCSRETAALGGLFALGAFLLWRLYGLTWQFASNVPFSDQWAFWNVLFDGFQWSDLWHAYQYQHGPHRQGLSFALIVPFYAWSGWNIRVEALINATYLVVAGLLALRLRCKLLSDPLTAWDGIVLMGFWGVLSHETVFVTPNASHSIAPLALLMLWLNAWVAPLQWWRIGVLLLITHALCFTGFGVSVMPALAFVVLLQLWRGPRHLRMEHAVLLLGMALVTLHFSIGYEFNAAVDNFDRLQPSMGEYARFFTALMQFFLQRQNSVNLYGWFGLLYGLTLCVVGVWALLQTASRADSNVFDRRTAQAHFWPVVLLMVGTTLTFAVLTTYGRTLLGLPAAMASRYTVLMLPGFFAVYLVLFRFRSHNKIPLLLLLLLMVARLNPEYQTSKHSGEIFGTIKACWLDAYAETGDFDVASQRIDRAFPEVGFQPEWMGTPEQWRYLKAEQLGPYSTFSRRWGVSAFVPKQCPP